MASTSKIFYFLGIYNVTTQNTNTLFSLFDTGAESDITICNIYKMDGYNDDNMLTPNLTGELGTHPTKFATTL